MKNKLILAGLILAGQAWATDSITYTIKPVNDGTYFCVATAYNKAKTESAYSNEVSKIVVNKPNKPLVK
jgi:hypothetical protein